MFLTRNIIVLNREKCFHSTHKLIFLEGVTGGVRSDAGLFLLDKFR